MGEMVQVGSQSISLSTADRVSAMLVELARPAIVSLIREAAATLIQIGTALITLEREAEIHINYYTTRGQYLRTDVHPIVALADAVQIGRDLLLVMRLDEDLRELALQQLWKRYQFRLGRLGP
jgi:hypothetical protein